MANDSRSPDICPWDPGEVCKAANGACLPPRKRLLAGLKQNGWLSSSPPYFKGVSGASCAPEELKLEVDLRETKHECAGDSPNSKQGECNTVEEQEPVSISVKSKRAIKRRKSLSVLADCRNSVKNLQPELLKSCGGVEIQEKVRSNKVSIESLLTPKRQKASVHHYNGYNDTVNAARAAAAKAEKAAAEAKSIALEKAVAAAKAAAIARAALEAVALTAEGEVLDCQPSRNGWASCEQNRIGNQPEEECGSGPKLLPLPHFLLRKSVAAPLEENSGNKRTSNGSASFIESKDVEETQPGQSPTVAFHPVDIDAVLDRIKEDEHIQSGQSSFMVPITASVDSTPYDKHEGTQKTHKICTFACPMPPPSDDEKLARQLHRAMNSSPRISRSRACLEYCRKSETSPISIDGCTQIRYQKTGGYGSSKEKKQPNKDKLRVSRSSTSKADIKTKSMTAINETLSMLQKATIAQCRVLGSTGAYFAASDEYGGAFDHKGDDSMPDDSNDAFVSLANCNDEGSTLTGSCDADGCHNVSPKAKNITGHFQVVGRDDDFTANKRVLRKLNSRRRKQATGGTLTESEDGSKTNELLSTCADSQSYTPSNVASQQTDSYLETSYHDDYEGSDENRDAKMVSGPGSTAGGDGSETCTMKTTQENLFLSKSGRAIRRIPGLSLHGERPKRGQKILGVLANGLSEGNRNFGKSLSSYLHSPAAL